MQPAYQKQSKLKLASVVITIIVIAGIVLLADYLKAKDADSVATTNQETSSTQQSTPTDATTDTSTATTDPATNTTTTTPTTSAPTSAYKDGTYTASSNYFVPSGYENIKLTLTVNDGVITDSSIVNSESDHDSARYQQDFTSLYKSYVVGKSIKGLKIGVLAGASDTAQGFNDALSQIALKAQG